MHPPSLSCTMFHKGIHDSPEADQAYIEHLKKVIAAKNTTIAAFQKDKERWMQIQFSVDMKQRRLKEELRAAQRKISELMEGK